MDEGRLEPAPGEPRERQPLVLRGDDEGGPLEPAGRELGRRRSDQAHRIEPGVEQLDDLGRELGDPVGAGETDIPRAQVQHLDDVLRLQDLGLETTERQVRPIAPPSERHPDPGIREQRQNASLHPPLGQGQMHQVFPTLSRGAHRQSPFRQRNRRAEPSPPPAIEQAERRRRLGTGLRPLHGSVLPLLADGAPAPQAAVVEENGESNGDGVVHGAGVDPQGAGGRVQSLVQ
jgi:hypothetical protein